MKGMPSRSARRRSASSIVVATLSTTLHAAVANGQTPNPTNSGQPAPLTAGFWQRPTLLGDPFGARTYLTDHGVTLGLIETSEVLGNPIGGVHQGVVYEGLTEASLGLDLDKLFGLAAGIVNFSAFQIHGRGLSGNNLDNLNIVSNIEATRQTRLFEAYYQQGFFGGHFDVRAGQLAADQEFQVSQYSSTLINATSFGWPGLPSDDLPSGGPAYPLATPGVRARWFASDTVTVMAGMYDANPAGPGVGDPQRRDASGTSFRVDDGVFGIAEVQYALNGGTQEKGLPGTYKAGVWYLSQGSFSQDRDNQGISLAALGSDGTPRRLSGDTSVYVMVDQLVSREAGSLDHGLGVFLRAMAAPQDRNLVTAFLDAGASYKGLIHGRGDDVASLGLSYTRLSRELSELDEVARLTTGLDTPVRHSETLLEATYQMQLTGWCLLQPDVQYVVDPGGGIADPLRPSQRIKDALVAGLRTTITF